MSLRPITTSLLALVLATAATVTPAPAATRESTPQQVAYGAGSFFGTLLYAPAKTGFCVLGALASGLALPFGGTETAGRIATGACAGTWVITPSALKGQEPVRFVGQ
jgi:hypothetical protein